MLLQAKSGRSEIVAIAVCALASACTASNLPGISAEAFAERSIACAALFEAERRYMASRGAPGIDGTLVVNRLAFRNAAIDATGIAVDYADVLVDLSAEGFAPLFDALTFETTPERVMVASDSEAKNRLVAGYDACSSPAAAAAADDWPPRF